jgi:serine/threonine-protein kinase
MSETTVLNNRYQLRERLGSGGMAMVYLAYDLTLERTVAIKILRKDFSDDPGFRKRFHQEAKAAANLSHPNIVTVHDFGLYADQIFIVMEFVPGTDLKSLLKQHGRFNLMEAIELTVQACSGIGYAHRSGLVHCDIKPQNLLVTPDQRLKVLDFGIARALSSIHPDERSEVVWGSPQYFSPEQASGGAPSPASDVYSLGIVLYELLTGRLPFIADNADDLARLHRDALPPSPRHFNPAIPPQLEQILLKVLSKEPSARYRTADQLGRVLTNFTQTPPSASQPVAVQPIKLPVVPPGSPLATLPGTPAVREAPRPPLRQPVPQHNSATYAASVDYSDDVVIEVEPGPEMVVITPPPTRERFDLLTWALGLLALLALGWLIPFWLWVLYRLQSPV